MADPDSASTRIANFSQPEAKSVAGVTDPYLREQLEIRRTELKAAISVMPATEQTSSAMPLAKLLQDVDSAVQRMDTGTYGICDVCHDTIEKDRLIADPLTTLCLDHLTGEEQRALERDLELAAQIQRGLLPPTDLRLGGWQIHCRYKPAGVVSGDYCDVISATGEGGKPIFLVGDVSGKGVAAALLMSHLHAMFRSLSAIGLDLDKLLEIANRLFCESTLAGQYATLICGRIGASGEVELASGGHVPALLLAKDGVKQIDSTGLPLGMFSTGRYTVQKVRLDPGDSLLLFTDGILEANGPSGEEYGIERLSRVVGGRHSLAARELATGCLEDLERYSLGARPTDDRTLMVVQRAASQAVA
jgi:sigma-B regulation protein RsbU (phosphoserine phosphatase)